MRKQISLVLFLNLLLCLTQVTVSNAQLKNSFIIKGNIEQIKDSTLIELIDIESQVRIAAAYTKDNRFIMQGSVASPTSCWLIAGNEYAILQIENLPMDFRSPLKNMRWESRASAGPEQALQNQLNDLQRPYEQIGVGNAKILADSLNIPESRRSALKKEIDEANRQAQKSYIEFGKDHSNSYLGLDILYRNRDEIGKTAIAPLYKKLSKALKNTPQAQGLRIFLYERLAEVGKPMIDFEAKTFVGNHFKLAQLKGKYIYLTFGEVGCAPCRLENKQIKANFDRLKDKISFVNFSMDKTRKAWEAANKYDGITWDNVSSLEGEVGKVKNLYSVQAMPTSYLIDTNGIIVKKLIGFQSDFIDVIEKMANFQP